MDVANFRNLLQKTQASILGNNLLVKSIGDFKPVSANDKYAAFIFLGGALVIS